MQALLLSFNALLLVLVLIALVKGSRVAYLTGLRQGLSTGKTEGYHAGIQAGIAAAVYRPGRDEMGMMPVGGALN